MLSPRIVLQIKWGNALNVFLTVPGHMEEIDKLLEIYNLPRLNQEEIENINRWIIRKEIA